MFLKKKKEFTSTSLNALVWKRFKKNKMAVASLFAILFFVIIAVLGYLITPDSTPYANQQYLELSTLKPGSKTTFLCVEENKPQPNISFLKKMFYGKPLSYFAYPIYSYWIDNDKIYAESYTGTTPNEGDTLEFALLDVCFPLDNTYISVRKGDQFSFKVVGDDRIKTISLEDLQSLTEKKQIKKRKFLLGTDRYGRDVLSQLMIGTRVSLSVGFIAVIISLIIGITLGALAAYYGKWVDAVIVWFINVVWSIPTILLVIAITFALGKGFWQIFIAVGLTMWVDVARLVRGQVLSIKEKEYVEAARALGFKPMRIIFKHILPNIMGAVIVITASNFASAILLEAGLSFLGIGVQPPMPSWGMMIKENYPYIILDAAYLAFLPGIAIMILVLAFMLVGNGIRSALDTKN